MRNFSTKRLHLPQLNPRRCVIKIGSSLLALQRSPYLNVPRLSSYVRQITKLIELGWDVVLVSSGAVAAGMCALGFSIRPNNMSQLQACAAVGQVILMKRYANLFSKRGFHCGQVLLTADDLRSRKRYVNAKNTLLELLDRKIIPIVNENDTVSTDEIAFGDNDKLSAMVAGCCGAKVLIILSDVDGLYSSFESKTIVPVVEKVDTRIKSMVVKAHNPTTVGGMTSKLEAADLASRWGIYTVLASGRKRNILLDLLCRGVCRGTVFLPSRGKHASRKMWIGYVAVPKGEVLIDKGAYNAIVSKGKSLLCAGIKGVAGNFNRSDVIKISCEGREVGRGIAGLSSHEIAQFLGRRAVKEAIHRDNMVLWENVEVN